MNWKTEYIQIERLSVNIDSTVRLTVTKNTNHLNGRITWDASAHLPNVSGLGGTASVRGFMSAAKAKAAGEKLGRALMDAIPLSARSSTEGL